MKHMFAQFAVSQMNYFKSKLDIHMPLLESRRNQRTRQNITMHLSG